MTSYYLDTSTAVHALRGSASAESIAGRLWTLDAIHLASALPFGSDTVVATHDAALKVAVETVGLTWIDSVSPPETA